jgi:hypothetical protein
MAKLSKQEYAKQKKEEQRKLLADAVEKLLTSEGWQQYLDTRARFHKYSFFNTILINLQKPEATQVGGAKSLWNQKFNRMIKKGEKAIKILAPVMVYEKGEGGKPLTDEKGKKIISFIWYRTVPVFDVSQTEGDPIPEMPLEPITGNSHEEFLYRTEQFVQGLGADVRFEVGDTEIKNTGGALTAHINAAQPINAQVRELICSAAEIAGPDMFGALEDEPTDAEKRVITESAAYLVCRTIGLDTAGMTVPFIADVDGDPVKVMKEFAGHVDELAATVEEAIRA